MVESSLRSRYARVSGARSSPTSLMSPCLLAGQRSLVMVEMAFEEFGDDEET